MIDIDYIFDIYGADLSPHFQRGLKDALIKMKNQNDNECEKSRLNGVLLGLSLAKKSISEGHGYNDILENEKIYQEELNSLNTPQ